MGQVTIASVMGTLGVSQASDYCASKAASISLHESLRQELDSRLVLISSSPQEISFDRLLKFDAYADIIARGSEQH